LSLRVTTSLGAEALAQLAAAQLNASFPDGEVVRPGDLHTGVRGALPRLEHCFTRINNKYFFDGNSAIFDHLHGDQYAMWLYLLGNELFRSGAPAAVCKKLFLLNKQLHACDIFYEVELPAVFLLVHPLGTVLGRAKYSDYLLVYQRCGVGSNHDVYPTLGPHLTLRPGSAVLGACRVAENCSIATESLLLDRDLAANSVYIGNPRDHVIRTQAAPQPIWHSI
jgi:serine O-acetyltransferase